MLLPRICRRLRTPSPSRTDLQMAFEALRVAAPQSWVGWTLEGALADPYRGAIVRGRALQVLRRETWRPPRRLRGLAPFLDHKRVAAGERED